MTTMWQRGVILLIAGLFLAPVLATRLVANVGMHLVNRGLEANSEMQLVQAQTILNQIPDDVSSQRGRADIAMVQQDLALAADLWHAAGEGERLMTRGDAIQFIGDEAADSVHNAMSWYVQAVEGRQDSAELWFGIGRLCRMNFTRDALCRDYVARQNDNLLLNPNFLHGLDGWTMKQADGASYDVIECAEGDRCVQIISGTQTPDFAVTLLQCVAVEEGKTYRFSAKISLIDLDNVTAWLPLYLQAFSNGEVREIQSDIPLPKTTELTYFETQFVMPPTDDGLICLHLARVNGATEILIKTPALHLVDASGS